MLIYTALSGQDTWGLMFLSNGYLFSFYEFDNGVYMIVARDDISQNSLLNPKLLL